ncbi:hypothetical protein, partial [Leisingera sp. ANG-M1]|uniref:hypothetical protein n=1 Tax=Leisingera sp. ANG-M1 TaxID=1577895 RepID=UPI00187CFA25
HGNDADGYDDSNPGSGGNLEEGPNSASLHSADEGEFELEESTDWMDAIVEGTDENGSDAVVNLSDDGEGAETLCDDLDFDMDSSDAINW